jgi:hypothetical protein
VCNGRIATVSTCMATNMMLAGIEASRAITSPLGPGGGHTSNKKTEILVFGFK